MGFVQARFLLRLSMYHPHAHPDGWLVDASRWDALLRVRESWCAVGFGRAGWRFGSVWPDPRRLTRCVLCPTVPTTCRPCRPRVDPVDPQPGYPSPVFEQTCFEGCGCCANFSTQVDPAKGTLQAVPCCSYNPLRPGCDLKRRPPTCSDNPISGNPEWCGICGPTPNSDRFIDFCIPHIESSERMCAENCRRRQGPLCGGCHPPCVPVPPASLQVAAPDTARGVRNREQQHLRRIRGMRSRLRRLRWIRLPADVRLQQMRQPHNAPGCERADVRALLRRLRVLRGDRQRHRQGQGCLRQASCPA